MDLSCCEPLIVDIVLQGSRNGDDSEVDMQRLQNLENENEALKSMIQKLEARVAALEVSSSGSKPAPPKVWPVIALLSISSHCTVPSQILTARLISWQAEPKPAEESDDDDDIDLFGSDEEVDEEAEKLKAERLAAYAAKKAKKPTVIAKSNLLIDVSVTNVCILIATSWLVSLGSCTNIVEFIS